MRWIILDMLSSASLSAFSASVMNVGLGPVQPGAPLRPFTAAPQNAAPSSSKVPTLGAPPPAGTMPRGSLLDLSV